MRLRQTSGSSAACALARVLLLAGVGAVLVSSMVLAEPSATAWGYLRSYLDAKEKLGPATGQTEGMVEVRGTIQGKMSSQQATTWIVRDDAGDAATYQLISSADLPAFVVGTRVRALGRGLATPGASLELVAMVLDAEMAAWEQAQAPQQPAARPEPTRIITYPPASHAAAPSVPAAERTTTIERPVPTRSASAPKAPAPPRWREPSAKARSRAAAPRKAPQRQSTETASSRAWAGYLSAYTRAIRWFNPRLTSTQADGIARSILAFSAHYRIDPRLVVAVIAVESDFHPTATSNKGAMGLGQLMPGTAAGLGVRNAYDPVENIYGAVKLLRGHLKEHSGKPFWNQLALALASYNAGSGAVRRYGGVPPYRETQRYVTKVAQLYAHLCGYRARK